VASPSDLPTGYIKIVNPRDSTYVPCLTVNGLVVSDNDLVNVLFTRGTEPIALSQSANSPSNTLKVSEIWDSAFNAAAMEADATGNITINSTGTLTIPTDLIHAGDTDTKISFTDDIISFDAGGINLLKLTETAQNLVEIGDVAGGGDVDVSMNSGVFFLRGSDDHFAMGPDASVLGASTVNIQEDQAGATRVQIRNATAGATAQAQIRIANDSNNAFQCGITSSTFTTSGELTADDAFFQSLGGIDLVVRATGAGNIKLGTNGVVRQYINSSGDIGIGVGTSPQGRLHGYDSISGFLHWEYDGLDGTSRTIIPNGTGDVLYRLTGRYVLRDSAGAVASGAVDVSNGGSQAIVVGANTVTIAVAATGATTVSRTAGADTIKVGLWLLWL
jgi:hypothetical protein